MDSQQLRAIERSHALLISSHSLYSGSIMASPPYIHQYGNSASPPYPQNNSLPRKRPSDVPASAPIIKKRKSSIASISTSFSHPLRQTSFPPEAAYGDGTRSPSVDTASLVSGSVATAPVKGKRGRKPKNKGEDASNVSTKAGGTNTGGGKDKGRKADEEEDDEDEGVDNMAVTTVARTNEEKEKEKQHRALLVSAFDDAQFSRYEVWRSSRLPDAVVRRVSLQASIILWKCMLKSLACKSDTVPVRPCYGHRGCQSRH